MISPRRRATGRAATLALALAIPAIAASPALAGTVSYTTLPNGTKQMKFSDTTGQYNRVDWSQYSAYQEPTRVLVEDTNPIVLDAGAQANCVRYQNYVGNGVYEDDLKTAMCAVAGISTLVTEAGLKDDYVKYGSDLPLVARTTNLSGGDDGLDDHTAGSTTITGGDGFDTISTYGGGSDKIDGNAGDDTIYSDSGADVITGGFGDDSIRVANGSEQVSKVRGNEGRDTLTSGNGNDELSGDADNDYLHGHQGTDKLDGGDGDDVIDGDRTTRPLPDTITGGLGNDTVDYSWRIYEGQAVNVSLDGIVNDGMSGEKDVLSGIENIKGGSYDDVLTGNANANKIEGGGGDDVVAGGFGADTLTGDSGKDLLTGSDGDDYMDAGSDYDSLDGGNGDDDMFGGSGDDDLMGADGADKMRADDGIDDVDGGPGLDNIDTGPGNDTVRTRDNNQELLSCGGGADLAYVDFEDVHDGSCAQLVRALGASVDRVSSRIVFSSGAGAGSTMSVTLLNGVLTFSDTKGTVSAGTGCTQNGAKVNCPAAGVLALTMDGNDGNDTLSQTLNIPTRFIGGPGNDTFTDTPASDSVYGGDGDDTYNQSAAVSSDSFYGGDGKDTVSYSARTTKVAVNLDSIRNDGSDADGDTSAEEGDYIRQDVENVTGGGAADWLRGSNYGNTLNGGLGGDRLSGGLGADTLNGQGGSDIINSRDGNQDAITCGTEGGQLTKDAVDTNTQDCTVIP